MDKLTSKKDPIIIVSQDYSGMGWVKLCLDNKYPAFLAYKAEEKKQYDELTKKENITVEELSKLNKLEEDLEKYGKVGEGVIPRISLDELMKRRTKYKNAYWIWDGNHNYEEGELLRKEGFKRVFGGTKLTYEMEHNRQFGTDMIKKVGLPTPETKEFSKISEGLKFLENEERAFVFKPDEGEGSYSTYVPDSEKDIDAHDELVDYMKSLPEEGGNYILQERKKGVESNFEIWVYKGKPFFAFCCLESKRRSNKDRGEMVGCAHDIAFKVPLNCKGVRRTVLKLLPFLPKDYTGFLDMNIISQDNQDYFLEFCARFGYNSHPNLFMNLAIKPFHEIMIDFIDGKVNDFDKLFRVGFGASILCRIDHPKTGFPLFLRDDVEKDFFFFDAYKEKGKENYCLSGYGSEVGIVCGHDNTIKTAAEEVLEHFSKVNFPTKDGRTDIDKNDYHSSPQARYDGLEAMNYFDVHD